MKKLPAARFLSDSGLLFEINRRVLHPRGLALEVIEDDDGTLTMSQELQDHRGNIGGICFGEDSIETGQKKLAAFDSRPSSDELSTPRSFDYVVFWDECAWVAATLGPYVVAQGKTCVNAVSNLEHTLTRYREYDRYEGVPAWTNLKEGEMVPPDSFAERARTGTPLAEVRTPDPRTSYVGTLKDL